MKRYLCSHWGLNPADEAFVKSMGFSGLRFDIPWGAPRAYIRDAFDTMAKQRLEVLAIIGGWMRWQNDRPVAAKGFAPPLDAIYIEARKAARVLLKSDMPVNLVAFEIGNEPDLSNWNSPREFAEFVKRGASGIWQVIPTATVVVGGVSNVDRKGGAQYLDAICSSGVHKDMILGVHPYRSDRLPTDAPKGWKSIHDVFKWLRSKGRPIWVTECGWHSSPQKRHYGPWGICSKNVQWSDEEIAEFASVEMDLWENAGAERYCHYQMNSGPNPDYDQDNFGVRDVNLVPKPIAREFQRVWGTA